MEKISKQAVRAWLRARRESQTPPPDRAQLIGELRHLTRQALDGGIVPSDAHARTRET